MRLMCLDAVAVSTLEVEFGIQLNTPVLQLRRLPATLVASLSAGMAAVTGGQGTMAQPCLSLNLLQPTRLGLTL